MAAYINRYKKTPKWVEGMQLPEGKRHDDAFRNRINNHAGRVVGKGSSDDPRIYWLTSELEPEDTSAYEATEAIVRQQLKNYGLRYAWIVANGHGQSTVGRTRAGRVMSDDDNHITLRMGLTRDTCNIHGHFYLIYEGNDPTKRAIRMMSDSERSIVGGKNPQLWVMGSYPKHLQRTDIKFPETPFEIIPGSIFDRSMEEAMKKGAKK
ncbi:hypothetical protein F5Y10DRAFT_268235 [Nemania abortiva]|nr:hypothetical protein F5Y10DRAFT_268235 [Nemania abortiva]